MNYENLLEQSLANSTKDIELRLVGCLIVNPTVSDQLMVQVSPEDFFDEDIKKIYRACVALHERGIDPDTGTLYHELNSSELISVVIDAASIGTSVNWEYYADQVVANSQRRKLLGLGQQLILQNTTPNSKIDDTIDAISNVVSSLFSSSQKDTKQSSEIADSVVEHIKHLKANPNKVPGIPTGFPEIDRHLAGLHKTDLIILAARPARGKSSFALQLAKNAALWNKTPTMFFSLEMGSDQLMQRILASESRVSLQDMRSGTVNDDQMLAVEESARLIGSIPLFFNDRAGITVKDIRKHLKQHNSSSQSKIGLVVVDYLQLMAVGGKENMVQAVTEISRGLKMIAKEFDVPVIALSQLSRNVEQRGGEPRLSDLRDSGSIEQDADIVAFLHSDKSEDDAFGNKELSFIVAKHRNGSTFKQNLEFNGSKMIFRETINTEQWD